MFSNAPTRNANEIVLYLSRTQPPPATVPFELQNQITAAVWDLRVSSVIQSSSRYSKPWFERIWMVLALVAIIVVPIAIQSVIYDAILQREANGIFFTPESVVKAKAILFAVFLGTCLFFLTPITVWKLIGRYHLNAMTRRWNDADRQTFGQNAAPQWKVKSPGVFRDSTVLYIGLPPGIKPSSFHPNAYLGSYINSARDADADYYYPYKSEPGLPRMSVVGNVPLYQDNRQLAYQKV
ncbi:hypothetical protein V5O48_004674 [Marasmius crinis-equi]|uniref:Uncharacterized protein n=1 Tax=Marasmius crinis-equi TaxID=585013 RepID=A0ABR3FPI9_9AGAR